MSDGSSAGVVVKAQGTEESRRNRPRRHELIGCGLHSHELLGTDAAALRAARDAAGAAP